MQLIAELVRQGHCTTAIVFRLVDAIANKGVLFEALHGSNYSQSQVLNLAGTSAERERD